MKRWTTGLTVSLLSAALLLGGCAGTLARSGGVSPDGTSLTTGASTAAISSSVTEISGTADAQSAYIAFLKSFYEKDPSKNTNSFYFRDLDNNGVQELILRLSGTKIKVYTFDGRVTEIGSRDFMTGTLRLLFSENPAYPGILYFTVSGGLEQYGYLTLKDNALTYEKLWDEDYTGRYIKEESRDRVMEYSSDKQLIEESRISYQENKDIAFTPLECIG